MTSAGKSSVLGYPSCPSSIRNDEFVSVVYEQLSARSVRGVYSINQDGANADPRAVVAPTLVAVLLNEGQRYLMFFSQPLHMMAP